ncbi:MAG: glycosyltransferase family 4 protein [Planctomycetes bacterium]|nr:glycosyltransferase family 4 protein [Planctomycetota bacterium]
MRVLFVTQSIAPEHPVLGFTRGWIAALARRVDHVDVVAREGGPAIGEGNVQVHAPSGGLLRRPRCALHYWRALRRRPDVVFVHMVPRWAAWARRLSGSRGPCVVLWYAHGTLDPWLAQHGEGFDRIYTPDEGSCPLCASNVHTMGHGIALQGRLPDRASTRAERTILVAGRIAERKRTDLAIETYRRVARSLPGTRLVLVGTPLTHADTRFAARLHAATANDGDVAWSGTVEHGAMNAAYRGSDVLLHPSATGSLDKVVLEAWGAGLPVVAREVTYGAFVRSVDPEAVVAGDDPEVWARAVVDLLALPPEEAERRARERHAHVMRTHSLERLMDGIVRDLEHLLSRSPHTS